jgi:hypothetical protein
MVRRRSFVLLAPVTSSSLGSSTTVLAQSNQAVLVTTISGVVLDPSGTAVRPVAIPSTATEGTRWGIVFTVRVAR